MNAEYIVLGWQIAGMVASGAVGTLLFLGGLVLLHQWKDRRDQEFVAQNGKSVKLREFQR